MANFTEVYEGQFNLSDTGVDDIIAKLQDLDKVAQRIGQSLGKFNFKLPNLNFTPTVDTSKMATATAAVQAAGTQIQAVMATTADLAGKDFQQMTEIVRSQIARLPDKTAPEFFKITDQFKALKNAFSAADTDKEIDAVTNALKTLSGQLDQTALNQAKLKTETLASQSALGGVAKSFTMGDKLDALSTQFDNVRQLSNLTSTSISDRWGGVGLLFSSTGSKLEGLREIFAGTNASSNLLVKGLDAIISRGDPMKSFSSDMAKSLATIADNTNRAFQSLQLQQANLKQTFTKEVGTGSAVFEKFNEQLTKTNAALKQLQVTALSGGDVSTALIRARVEAKNLETAYRLVAQDGVIPAGTQTEAMFKEVGTQIESTDKRLQAMASRYEGVKKKISEVRAEQDKQNASGEKQVGIFGRISNQFQKFFSIFSGGKRDVDTVTSSFQNLDSQVEKTNTMMETLKGSFLGSFAGTVVGAAFNQFTQFISGLGDKFFSLNDTIQNTKITIQGMLTGSGVDAQKAIEGFNEFVTKEVAKTPFEFQDAIEASLRLVQQGFDPQKWFEPAANAAAAMNKPMEQFIGGLVKLQAGAKGAAIDMFRDFGLNVNQISGYFDKATGQALSFDEVQKRTAAGTIGNAQKLSFEFDKQGSLANSTGDALKIMNAYLSQNATFAQAASARSQSLSGVISNLKDNVSKVLIAFGQPIFDKLTIGASGLLSLLDRIGPSIQNFAAQLGTNVANAITFVSNLFSGDLLTSMQNSEGIFLDFANIVTAISQGQWQIAWQIILEIVADTLTGITDNLDSFASNAYDWGANFMGQIADGIISAANSVLDAVSQIGETIASYLMPGSPPEQGPLSNIDTWGQGIMNTFTSSMSDFNAGPVTAALDKLAAPFDTFNQRFDLGKARDQVASLQQQILAAQNKGFVPASLKQQLGLAQDKVTLLEQQQQLEQQIAQQQQQQQKANTKAKKSGGGGAQGSPKERVTKEKETNQQIRDDALKILEAQLKDGIIDHESYVKQKLNIYEKFYKDESALNEKANQRDLTDSVDAIKELQGEMAKIEASKKKGKKEKAGGELFTPTSAKDIFQNFADSVTKQVTQVGTEVGGKFVDAVKTSTVKQLETAKTTIVTKFNEITTKAATQVGGVFTKLKSSLDPKLLLLISAIAGALVYLAAGPVIAGIAALGGAIAALLAGLGGLLLILAQFTAIGLVVTAIILNWDKIAYAAGLAIDYVKGIVSDFIKASGGIDALKNNFNAALNVISTESYKFITTMLNGIYKIISDFNFKGAFYSFKRAFENIDLSALKNTLSNLFAPMIKVVEDRLPGIKQKILDLIPPQVLTLVEQFKQQFANLFTPQQGTLGAALVNLFKQLGELFKVLMPVFKVVGEVIGIVLVIAIDAVVSAFQGLASAMPFITGAIAGLTTFFTGLIDLFTGLVSLVTAGWALVTGDTQTASVRWQAFLTNMASAITNIFSGALQFIVNVGIGFLAWSFSFVTSFVANILQFIPGFQTASQAIVGFRDYVITAMSTLVTNVTAIIFGLSSQLMIILPALWNGLVKDVAAFITNVGTYFSSWKDSLLAVEIPDIMNGLTQLFTDLKDRGAAFFQDALNNWKNVLSAAGTKFKEIGLNLILGLLDGIKKNAPQVLEFLKQMIKDSVSGIISYLGIHSPSVLFRDIGVNMVEGLNKGVGITPLTIGDYVGQAADAVEKQLKNSLDPAKVRNILAVFKRTFRDNFDEIVSAGAKKGGNLLGTMSNALKSAGIEGGIQAKKVAQGAESMVRTVIEIQKNAPATFANQAKSALSSLQKLQADTLQAFNKQIFNIRSSSVEARIELERLFNRTVTNQEVERMAKAFEGVPIEQLTAQQQLILRNYLLQQKLAGATEQEAKVRNTILASAKATSAAQDLLTKLIPPPKAVAAPAQAVGNNILTALGLGMDAGVDDVLAKIASITERITGQLEGQLGIHSPSTVFAGYGQQLMAGLTQGINATIPQLQLAMAGVNTTLSTGLDVNAFSQVPSFAAKSIGRLDISGLDNSKTLPPIHIEMNNTINNEYDEAQFRARVLQTVREAVRTGQ